MEVQWNVFYYNVNERKVTTIDIFKHSAFKRNVLEAMKKYSSMEDFAKKIRSELMYYFWCKYEYEVMIVPYSSRDEYDHGIKVDIFTQVMTNWDQFVEYLWARRSEVK